MQTDARIGIHKHFHLMALHQDLLSNGHIHPRNEHTKPPGIWRKLESVYDLEVLDEREDARQLENVKIPSAYRGVDEGSEDGSDEGDDDADVYSEAANKIENEEFSLPGEDFAARKWMQRLPTDKERRDESPPLLPELNMADEPPVRFTPSFSIEPPDLASPTSKKGRGRAGTTSGRTTAASTRRSTRQAESGADEGDEEDEDQDEEAGEDEESSEDGESEQSTPARRGTRNTKDTRAAKAKPRSRRK